MKSILITAICILGLLACRQTPRQQNNPETPKALQENTSSDYSLLSKKRSPDDLVESLYNELVAKSPELKELENRIEYLNSASVDSVEQFNEFDQKNKNYYSAADRHIVQIQDSLLREKMRSMLVNSLSKYDSKTSGHNNLIALLKERSVHLGDLHSVIKIVKTLPLIEKYQKDEIPGSLPINRVVREFDKTIKKLDSLSVR